ncbi:MULTISPECIES: GtrA family protein [unclassified Isoptericola]|uniref:GtrA family protein n=1 Tax=unclassified Isoptericola TaxID=2623355 RepID=UPI00271369D4|nr:MULTISPECIES: GtrA family protein [unclassified Isoptericola]MDO8143844.1 GtrA family protein [Isoptericola sp. 178]MDO8147739.1 GtrA family protein [Isoptericola sp. b515]
MRSSFVRFVLVGAGTGVLHLGVFVALRAWLDPVAANAVALSLATVVNTEGNRRFSFPGPKDDPVWYQHVKAALALLASLGLSAVAFSALEPARRGLEVLVVVGADATSTLVRFLLLRFWVFRPARGGGRARRDRHR